MGREKDKKMRENEKKKRGKKIKKIQRETGERV